MKWRKAGRRPPVDPIDCESPTLGTIAHLCPDPWWRKLLHRYPECRDRDARDAVTLYYAEKRGPCRVSEDARRINRELDESVPL